MKPRQRVLEKKLSYRLPVGAYGEVATLQSMHDHWLDFSWETGPVIVGWNSEKFPQVQVWASSSGEGKRVVLHALAHMGALVTDGTWQVAICSNPKYGRVTQVRAAIVSARLGPHGVAPKRWLLPPRPPT